MEYPALDRLGALAQGLQRMSGELSAKLAELSATTSTGASDSGLVTVEVHSTGAIAGVQLDPRAMRMFSEDLAEEFRQAATRAQEAASAAAKERVRTLLEPLPASEDPENRHHGY